MSFNNKIKQIKRDNYNTKPTNIEPWVNPFLRLSDNEIYNKLITSSSSSSESLTSNKSNDSKMMNDDNNHPKNIINKNDKINANNNNNSSSATSSLTKRESENLARHIMSEVYTSPSERRNIEGYRLSQSLSTPEHVVYIGNKGKNVLLGLRGSANLKDFVADTQIGLKNLVGLPDSLSHTLNNRYARDENVYNAIRSKYPNKHIVMAGHSLGNTLGMNILKNHKNDKNIIFYGYNGWVHPNYNRDKRAYTTRQEGDLVSLATPTSNTLVLTKNEKAAVTAGLTSVAGIYAYRRMKLLPNLKALTEGVAASNAKIDFVHDAQATTAGIEGAEGSTWQFNNLLMRHFPGYTSLDEILVDTAGKDKDYIGMMDHTPNVFIKNNRVADLRQYLIDNPNPDVYSEDYDYADLQEDVAQDFFSYDEEIEFIPFEDIVEGVDVDLEMALSRELTALAAETEGLAAASIAMGSLLTIGLAAGAAYYWWSHSAARFKIKNNKFSN